MNTTVVVIVTGIVALAILVLFAVVYGFPRKKDDGAWVKRTLSPTFARVYGLMSIAVLAVGAVLLSTDEKVLTPVFTLFGTIAGYLAGSKAETVTKTDSSGNTVDSLELN